MLEISDWNKNSRFIEVSTPDLAALTAALRDQPLQQATLFQDGTERRGMRKIKIEVVGQSNSAEVRIVHSDDRLNAVLAQTGRGGQATL